MLGVVPSGHRRAGAAGEGLAAQRALLLLPGHRRRGREQQAGGAAALEDTAGVLPADASIRGMLEERTKKGRPAEICQESTSRQYQLSSAEIQLRVSFKSYTGGQLVQEVLTKLGHALYSLTSVNRVGA